jgi:hypothetical protein
MCLRIVSALAFPIPTQADPACRTTRKGGGAARAIGANRRTVSNVRNAHDYRRWAPSSRREAAAGDEPAEWSWS